jgi:hypothetical protein
VIKIKKTKEKDKSRKKLTKRVVRKYAESLIYIL